ncbi:hypothetical protein [Romboutsia sp. 13368]|uniref:hypothetical protein n=1 Tax=Romboutsia sp. 13368 TaxID=2708053 RepID=UPI0025DA9579|nr:hypothetical protein [Romboutsia sp. 13368]
MNFDMYSNNQYNDDLDASYIYPRPYIDPMMYVNSCGMQMNPNTTGGYMTYMNPYMNNPCMYQGANDLDEYDEDYCDNQDDMYINMMQQQMQPMMPAMIPPQMMQQMMMQMMSGQMQPMMPYMMMPSMTPMMPYMMMPGMTPINIEEFDEEEM